MRSRSASAWARARRRLRLQPRPIERVLLEHPDSARHVADLVTAIAPVDLNRGVSGRQRSHRRAEPQQRTRDLRRRQPHRGRARRERGGEADQRQRPQRAARPRAQLGGELGVLVLNGEREASEFFGEVARLDVDRGKQLRALSHLVELFRLESPTRLERGRRLADLERRLGLVDERQEPRLESRDLVGLFRQQRGRFVEARRSPGERVGEAGLGGLSRRFIAVESQRAEHVVNDVDGADSRAVDGERAHRAAFDDVARSRADAAQLEAAECDHRDDDRRHQDDRQQRLGPQLEVVDVHGG